MAENVPLSGWPESDGAAGLTESEAARLLATVGPNELPSAKPRRLWRLVWEVVREPMLLLLLGCSGTYFVLGDVQEAIMLSLLVLVVIGITLYQERKTERALLALRDLSSPRALVIRQGQRRRIAGREVVPGDLLVIVEGDRVPADGFVASATNFACDESLLTGESVPVEKAPAPSLDPSSLATRALPVPGSQEPFAVYSGSLAVGGTAFVYARHTGPNTELGKIGASLLSLEDEPSLLQAETSRLVRFLALYGVGLCLLLLIGYGLTRGDWLRGFLAALTLAMSVLPEELPVVLTIFLALGAWRLSRSQVLTRHTPAIETLGATTTLCVDKTGTLTMNQMAVARLQSGPHLWSPTSAAASAPLPDPLQHLLARAALASQAEGFEPMDQAIRQLALAHQLPVKQWPIRKQYPLQRQLLAFAQAAELDGRLVVAAKGAAEAIAELCHLPATRSTPLLEEVRQLSAQGLRVLAVAEGDWPLAQPLPADLHSVTFRWLGLVALADPIRPSVPAAIAECHQAGIRLVMITGDHPGTANSIARQIGLPQHASTVTGPELAAMDDARLAERLAQVSVFARAVPEQKLRLVTALRARGEIVAMTGDGVNDAPALKAAHIGIAMGERGTDVAREAADLVLLDDDFTSIVRAVRMGRRIHDNLKKAVGYVFAIHVPIAGLSLLPILFNWPLILEPMHIAFLELIIDPACTLVFEAEAEEPDLMQRPPRPIAEGLFNRKLVAVSLLQGFGMLAVMVAIFAIAYSRGQGTEDARALTFSGLVISNLCLIVSNRSRRRNFFAILGQPNAAMWWVLGATSLVLALVLTVPALRELFHFSVLHGHDALLCAAVAAASIGWFELIKLLFRRRQI